jgi:hypothetical protein
MTGLLGLALGLSLYGLVCVRNACLPWARNQYGQKGYWLCWVAALSLMLVIANLGIVIVRLFADLSVSPIAALPLEVTLVVIALITGGGLALWRARNCSSCETAG